VAGVGCVVDRLSAFLDGDLPAAEAAAVRAHVEECAACARAANEMAAIVQAARSLDRPEPPVSLWPAIEGRLGPLEPVPEPERAGERRARFWNGWRPFAAGTLVGAAGVAALAMIVGGPRHAPGGDVARTATVDALGAGVAVVARDPLLEEAEAEFAQAAAAYERSIAKLRGLLDVETARWTSGERARYAERLERLDDAIARSREVARRSPGDSAGNEQLFAAYQQKIAFLAAAVQRGSAQGEEAP